MTRNAIGRSLRGAAWALVVVCAFSQAAWGDDLFENEVLPILERRCFACHSHASGAPMAGLALDSALGLRSGGVRGPAVVPENPDASLLYQAVLYEDDSLRMPPDGKLAPYEVEAVRRWIAAGAPDPRKPAGSVMQSAEAGPDARKLWSVQPLAAAAPPATQDSDWPRNGVDAFILAVLNNRGLDPSSDAKPHQLLRRMHYVLTGLPPSPADARAFETAASDDLDQALAGKADELLGSPHFGERWGRHWLDVARYADVSGETQAIAYREAWRYRDYIVEAFNQDKPFDRFVREQIAGDLLPASSDRERAENLVATGFLSLGHVPGDDRDPEKLKLDVVNEQLDTIGTALLGVRIGCARCHDHKLDPFPASDYYAMAGILRSTQAGPERRMGQGLRPAGDLPASDAPIWMRGDAKTQFHGAAEAAEIRDEPIHLRGEVYRTGELQPRGFPRLIAMRDTPPIPPNASGRLQLADWLLHEENPLVARVIVNRIWHHVFGQGLVRSTDNFGFTGDTPTHPALLDYLAARFRRVHGWSVKSLVRELLLSRTWRQSSVRREEAFEADPENRLLWRANTRRQEAEPLIDSLRAIAGTLDLSRPSGLELPKFKTGNQGSTADLAIPPQVRRRRAIYWPVFRKDTPTDLDLLPIFNFPSAAAVRGRRDGAVVPAQSLALLNSSPVLDAAQALAESLPEGDPGLRVDRLYRRVLARAPTAEERKHAERFVEDMPAADSPWVRLSHVVMVCNESITVP